jgi:hypothetical protein
MNNKYEDGKIYKIICNTTNKIYIGSTTESLYRRLKRHEYYYKNYVNNTKFKYKCHISSREIIQNNNYKIELIEDYPCFNKQELLYRERYWIEKIECINILVPIVSVEERKLTKKEYAEKNKEYFKEKQKQWFKRNYEIGFYLALNRLFETEEDKSIKNNRKKEFNKQYGEEYRKIEKNKNRQKELFRNHYEKNRDVYLERSKEYREKIKNDPILLEKQREYKRKWYIKKKSLA